MENLQSPKQSQKSQKKNQNQIQNKKRVIRQKWTFKGKGSYGCVIHPAIPCDDTDVKNRNKHVSKIFYEDEYADDEIFKSELINNFDKNQQYSIKPLKSCLIDTKNLPLQIHEECNFEDGMTTNSYSKFNKNLTFKKQIIYEDAGISLRNIFDVYPQIMYEDMLVYFQNLFEAVVKLNEANLIHLDIKPRNIVFNIDNKGRELRLIDFGLAHEKRIARISLKSRSGSFWERVKKKYDYYPFDFLLFDVLFDEKIPKNERSYMFLTRLTQQTNSQLNSRYSFIHNTYRKFINEKYNSFFLHRINDLSKTSKYYIEFIPDKIDVFSLGATLVEMFHFAQRMNKFRDAVWCENIVLPLISRIIHPSLHERLSSTEALKEWKQMLRKMKSKK